ncbi:MAG: hypothetical protein ACXV2A_06730 [Halobacteriota archaeon]
MDKADGRAQKSASALNSEFGFCQETTMDSRTLLIIIILVLVLGGGGFYGRGRWW